MVRAYSLDHTYKHPWELVTAASWRKFADPENKLALSHILQVDTLSHKLEPSSGKLYTTRAITIHAPGPWFVRKIIGQDICHCVELTVVDARTRSMQARNKHKDKAFFGTGVYGREDRAEMCGEFQNNSMKGREVMERICKYLESESRGVSV